ncbi:MAG: hypothetical protein DMG07_21505, partial [Acidobacteria bacterium]
RLQGGLARRLRRGLAHFVRRSRALLRQGRELWEVKNVFVTDGSSFTSSGCVNPTVTMMALTARACAYIAEQLRTSNL